jgi:hypothetical protein
MLGKEKGVNERFGGLGEGKYIGFLFGLGLGR